MSYIAWRPCYVSETEAESVPPDFGLHSMANEAALKLPKRKGAELVVSQYEVGDDGLSTWLADYRLNSLVPCYSACLSKQTSNDKRS